MYYKIVNTECEVYKKLRAQRELETETAKHNLELIAEKIPYKWGRFRGMPSQGARRIPYFMGFLFTNPEEVDTKIWKENQDGYFTPKKNTKAGKLIQRFLDRELKSFSFERIFKILDIDNTISSTFVLPYMEIFGDTILMYLDAMFEPEDENVIEITKKEFEEILHPYFTNIQ